jgi:hypothetical protein
MFEAIHLAEELARLMNEKGLRDGGAHIHVIVTDTAGNSATVRRERDGGWVSDEGFDVGETLLRSPAFNDPAMLSKTLQQVIDEHVAKL